MNNLIVTVNKLSRTVKSPKTYIGVDGENLQELMIFKFDDEFVDGVARLEVKIGDDKNFMMMDKVEETYTIPIKNVLTINGVIEMQLVITLDSDDEEEIPVFKSEIFKLYCKESISATSEAPDGYELWLDTANRKLAEMDNINIVADNRNNVLRVEITDRKGVKTVANIKEGKDGKDGRDGVIQYTAGTGINISPSNIISADGEKYYAGDNIQITNANVINAIIDLSNYYNKTQVDEMIGSLQSISMEIVSTLPATGDSGVIYLVPVYTPDDPPVLDYYTQHIYTNDDWEEIGTTRVDLTDYYTKVEVDELLDEKQDKLEEVEEPIAPITDNTIFSSIDLTSNQVSKIQASTLKNYIGRVSTNLQWEVLPPITIDNVGSIVQYIGEDTPTRKKGFWYQAVREFSWYAWVDPVTSTNVYTANREPGIGDNLHKLEGGVMVETDLVVSRVDGLNIYDQNNTRYTRNSSSDRDMTYKWEILNENLSEYVNDDNYLKEDEITGAISTAVSNDFTGNRVVVTTPLGKLTWSDITHEVLNYLSGVTSNVQTQLNGKQTQLFESPELVNFTDTVPLSIVSVDGNTVTPVKGLTIWNYIKSKMTGAISSVITSTLTSGKVVTTNASGRLTNSPVNVTELGYLEGLTKSLAVTEAVNANAFVYNANRSSGYYINGDYETNVKRRVWKQGNTCNLSFHCKGDVNDNYSAYWTYIGQVPSGFRPKYKTPIVAMVYDGVNGNDSAGGYIDTEGWVVLWTNNKSTTNNYQVRVNATYLLS